MSRIHIAVIAASCTAACVLAIHPHQVAAQQQSAARTAKPTAAPTAEWQIAAAVLAVPADLRAGAEVRAWTDDDDLVVIRAGTNGIICLADRPGDQVFSAACYHDALEPFMERGRELRRQGVEGEGRNQLRWQEIEAGTLPMPAAAMVYNLGFQSADFDPATVDPATGGRLHALYMPGATTESTGVSTQPGPDPWLMLPGTPSAHIMIPLPRKPQ